MCIVLHFVTYSGLLYLWDQSWQVGIQSANCKVYSQVQTYSTPWPQDFGSIILCLAEVYSASKSDDYKNRTQQAHLEVPVIFRVYLLCGHVSIVTTGLIQNVSLWDRCAGLQTTKGNVSKLIQTALCIVSVLRSDHGDSAETQTDRKHSGLPDFRPGGSSGRNLCRRGGPQRMERNI